MQLHVQNPPVPVTENGPLQEYGTGVVGLGVVGLGVVGLGVVGLSLKSLKKVDFMSLIKAAKSSVMSWLLPSSSGVVGFIVFTYNKY